MRVGYKAKKPNAFYGIYEEIGTSVIRKNPHLTIATEDNIPTIRQIQAQYLSGIGTESAERMIDEGDYSGE